MYNTQKRACALILLWFTRFCCKTKDIYDNTELVVIHEISNKPINYKDEHYMEGLKESMPYKTDIEIEELAKKNLELFDQLTKTN